MQVWTRFRAECCHFISSCEWIRMHADSTPRACLSKVGVSRPAILRCRHVQFEWPEPIRRWLVQSLRARIIHQQHKHHPVHTLSCWQVDKSSGLDGRDNVRAVRDREVFLAWGTLHSMPPWKICGLRYGGWAACRSRGHGEQSAAQLRCDAAATLLGLFGMCNMRRRHIFAPRRRRVLAVPLWLFFPGW